MKEGRGRLSSLDLIPEAGADDVLWALAELNKRQRSQTDILFELNDRLAVHGIEPVSRSAFNRRSMRMAVAARRLDEQRDLFAGLADRFTPEDVDEGNIVLGQMIKVLITEILDEPDQTPKNAMELARAYLHTIQGQKISSERRQKLKVEFEQKTEAAVNAVAKQKGLTPDTAAAIKAAIFGVEA